MAVAQFAQSTSVHRFVVKDPTLSTPVALDASATTAPGACFLLDDVALQRIR